VEFEWDPGKAVANVKKHGVEFSEAMTVFGDPLEVTISDPDHSNDEVRLISLGMSASGRFSSWRTRNVRVERASSTLVKRRLRNESNMNQEGSDEMRPEYDFSNGVRGKHYKAYRAGTNVVFLDPDIAEVFTDSAAVNQALRQLVKFARAHVSEKNRPDTALQPTARARRKAKPRKRSGAARS